MERVELVGGSVYVLRTRQLGPASWCCDVYERFETEQSESLVFEDFGESEIEAFAMAMGDAHEPNHLHHH
jgi:hypothetical protein